MLVGGEEVRTMGKDGQGVATGLSRGAVAEVLGVHVSSVRRYEARGWLHPSGGKGEERLFDAGEVKALARLLGRRAVSPEAGAGGTDATAFRMFRTGATHEEVVIALELPAERVRELFGLWRAGYGTVALERDRQSAAPDADVDEERVFREWEREMAGAHVADDDWSERHAEKRRHSVSRRHELAASLGFSDRPVRRE